MYISSKIVVLYDAMQTVVVIYLSFAITSSIESIHALYIHI